MGIVVMICLLPITSKPFAGTDEQLINMWPAKLEGSHPLPHYEKET